MTLLGIDVSHWQGPVDWNAAHKAGVAFGFAKATEGTGFTDSRFAANISGMRASGVVPGAYHFLKPGNPAGQADMFVRTAPPDVIHALDVEAAGLDVAGWVHAYRSHYPHKVLLVYTGRDLWTRAGGGNGALFGPLWAAGYVPNRYLPGGSLASVAGQIGSDRGGVPFAGWAAPAFLQFTDAARVPGVMYACDGDVFYGGIDDLRALTSTGGMDVALTDNEIQQIAEAVWNIDVIPDSQDPGNLTWKPLSSLGRVKQRADEIKALVIALAADSAARDGALTAALNAAVSSGGVLTPAELQAAAQAGAEAALDRLAQALDQPPVG